MSNKKSKSSSVNFCSLLAIAFIVLKLTKVISWSWLWVLSPLWVPVALSVVILIFYIIFKVIPELIENRRYLNNSDIRDEARKHRAEWVQDQFKFPDEHKAISFLVEKKWHNGMYEDGQFRIVGTKKTFDNVDVWYYK